MIGNQYPTKERFTLRDPALCNKLPSTLLLLAKVFPRLEALP